MKAGNLALTLVVVVASSATASQAETIETVPVGNPGNAADPATGSLYGAVDYEYGIAKHEVTNAQYVTFLNVLDPTGANTLALYDPNVTSNSFGGIDFDAGAAIGAKYSSKSGRANNPVNFVSWYDAIRFANWRHNGQGSGDTETGAYTLGALGAGAVPINGSSITRNAGALWWLTSEHEWYKAAYHKNDGVTGNYFVYPTSSDTAPTAEAPPGGVNSANYDGAFVEDFPTDVGAYIDSDSPYGTFDQAGNIWEWNEDLTGGSFRVARGGSYLHIASHFSSSFRLSNVNPTESDRFVGFRVATIPEPSTFTLAGLGLIGLFAYGWRQRRRT